VNLSDILSPSRKLPLSEEIASQLREAIQSGLLQPGERLGEEALAVSMRVSRGPIRDALILLEREGLVIKEHNRGAFVARLSHKDLDEVYSLRLALETLAIKLAIKHADPADLDEMQNVIESMKKYAAQGITEKLAAELDIHFHEVIYRASNHQRLYDHWANLKPQIYILLLGRMIASLDFKTAVIDGHQELLDAIVKKDESLSVKLLEKHLSESYERVSAGYERKDETLGEQFQA
jgi:DNA-binding GntR family transcriptional regulator